MIYHFVILLCQINIIMNNVTGLHTVMFSPGFMDI